MAAQLGRAPRGTRAIAHRCPCGNPDVVETSPRLADGTPVPDALLPDLPACDGRVQPAGVGRGDARHAGAAVHRSGAGRALREGGRGLSGPAQGDRGRAGDRARGRRRDARPGEMPARPPGARAGGGPRGEPVRRRGARRGRAVVGRRSVRSTRKRTSRWRSGERGRRTSRPSGSSSTRTRPTAGCSARRRSPCTSRCRSSGSRPTTTARVLGCGALHVMWEDLAEIRTVAVDPAHRGHKIGHQIVDRLLDVARELGVRAGLLPDLRDPVLRLVRVHRDRRRAGAAQRLRATAALVRRGCRRVPRPGAGQAQHPGEHANAAAPMRVAAIDCGTNSIRLLIADVVGRPAHRRRPPDGDRPARRGRRPHRPAAPTRRSARTRKALLGYAAEIAELGRRPGPDVRHLGLA